MLQYSAITGQSIWDICLNTYGTFDQMAKLLEDNDILNVDVTEIPRTIEWDENLSDNQYVNQEASNTDTKYATSSTTTGNVLSIVESSGEGTSFGTGVDASETINTTTDMSYIKTSETEYTAAGGEAYVILSELIDVDEILQIIREVQPLTVAEYTFNPVNGQITLLGEALGQYEVLYILYNKTVS